MSNTAHLSGRNKPRSKNGCLTCRIRKVKCDERRPVCQRCSTLPIKCDWPEPGQSRSLKHRKHNSHASVSTTRGNSLRSLAPSSPSTAVGGLQLGDNEQSPVGTNNPQPTLSTSHIPLANSLQLTPDDQAAFLHVPDSIFVLYYGKPWKWSCFSYIYTHIASRHAGVMRSFIAVAAMELRWRELLAAKDGDDSARCLEKAQRMAEAAAVHYSLALKELSSLLYRVCHSEKQSDDIDALFAMWFLILRFEASDSESTASSLVHLEGIRSFLTPYLHHGTHADGDTLPYVSQVMLLYTLHVSSFLAFLYCRPAANQPTRYLDADSANGDGHGGQLCADLLSRNGDDDFISHEKLFRSARSALPKIWRESYPVAELLDDMENYRPLRLFHLCQGAKLELLRLVRAPRPSHTQGATTTDLPSLWKHIADFGDEFADVLLLAESVRDSGGRRLMWTVYSAALDFYALQVLCSCHCRAEDDAQYDAEASLARILATATKALEENPRQIYRLMWALSVALAKTQQQPHHSHRQWLAAQLDRAHLLLPRFGVPDVILLDKTLVNSSSVV